MGVEDVTRVRLAPRRPAQEQRDLAVGRRLFRQVVVDTERVAILLVHEVLGHRSAPVGSDVLHRCRVVRRRTDDDGVVHRAMLTQGLHDARDRGRLEADGNVDANDVAALLVDDRVDRDRGLAGLAVADDQLALAPADWDHPVDRLDASHQRLFHRLPVGDAGCPPLKGHEVGRLDRALAVDGLRERIDHAPKKALPGGHRQDAAGALDGLPLADVDVGAEDDDADRVLFEVQREAERPVLEFDHLARHRVPQTVGAGDAVADLEHGADLVDAEVDVEGLDLLPDDRADLVGPDLHGSIPVRFVRRGFAACPTEPGGSSRRGRSRRG